MKKIAAAVALLLASSAYANDLGIGVGGSFGTQGLGVEVAKSLVENTVTVRGGLYGSSFNSSSTISDVDYDIDFKLLNVGVFGDLHPFNGSLRVTGGLLYNGNKFSLNGKPGQGGSFTLNGTEYQGSDIGSLRGDVTFDKVAPYLGIGGGNLAAKGKGLSFLWDIGVIFTSPKVSLSADCKSNDQALCAELANNVKAEESKVKDDAKGLKYWPVVKLGLGFHF